MDQLDPRLIEIEILTEADRAFLRGGKSFQYTKANPSGPKDWQRDSALYGLICSHAIVASGALHVSRNGISTPDHKDPDVTYGLERAGSDALAELLKGNSMLNLQITQVGRLRLFRLRDELLQRDRVRDDFGVLWAHRHWLPDLAVRLRFRAPKEPFSILLLDVDKLKSLNTELGNPGADKVLVGIFETLRDAVRPHDAFRLGGDEAGAILTGVSHEAAKKIGETIRAAVEARPWPGLNIQTKPTVSVGVGTYVKEADITAEAVYVATDRLRAVAKAERNKVVAGYIATDT